jgi:uncharacterized protein YecT (DUF1311 family)
MNRILCVLFLLALPVATSSQGPKTPCVEKATTQSEINAYATEDLKRADTELNQLYQQILKKYATDQVFIQKLRLAEEAWVKFREAHMAALDSELDPSSMGSVYPMCKAMEITRLTNERVEDLKRILNHPEGDVCAF